MPQSHGRLSACPSSHTPFHHGLRTHTCCSFCLERRSPPPGSPPPEDTEEIPNRGMPAANVGAAFLPHGACSQHPHRQPRRVLLSLPASLLTNLPQRGPVGRIRLPFIVGREERLSAFFRPRGWVLHGDGGHVDGPQTLPSFTLDVLKNLFSLIRYCCLHTDE